MSSKKGSEVGRLFCIMLELRFLQTVAVLYASSLLNFGSERFIE